jgi:hypothetical protein
MRFVFTLLLTLMLIPVAALAADWGHYANSRYGYEIAIPPGFSGQGESDNGDGQVFLSERGTEELRVFGGYLTGGDFSSEMAERQQQDESAGWAITYQASTPKWVSYSGTKAGFILYVRAIARCGDQYALFRLQYSKHDAAALDPVISRLVGSLTAGRC